MDTGTKISASLHVLLIGWALVGGVFDSEPLPFEVRDVSVITAEEFAALQAPNNAPVIGDVPTEPDEPETSDAVPDVAVEPDTPPDQAAPSVAELPEAETEPADIPAPAEPEIPVADVPPTPVVPDPVPTPTPELPQEEALPAPSDRVAPEVVAEPPPDILPDVEEQEQVNDQDAGDIQKEPQQATAPEAATDRIAPETSEVASAAPLQSIRPPSRRPDVSRASNVAVKPEETPSQPLESDTQDSVKSALAEALGGAQEPSPVPAGPPMSSGEKDSLRVAVSKCWNVGSLSSAALNTTVVVAVKMHQDGRPDTGSIKMLSSSGGDSGSARQAYEAARRAIIRCGTRGYDLPVEKYAHWRDIEMTFNPERMRIK